MKTCKHENCSKLPRIAGLCGKHYAQVDTFKKELRGNKTRDRRVLSVCGDIKRWRKKLKEKGLVVGASHKKRLEKQEERAKAARDEADIVAGKKRFF